MKGDRVGVRKNLTHTPHLARFDGLVHLVRVGRDGDEVPAAQQAVKAEQDNTEIPRGGRKAQERLT